ncbi:sigma-70 family RNA polymerase sigma factor [Subtercola endophyticus]|uniref:sigma-70 family RNA polymerase sigma factor n=1 Tax=Subtercola endophyticus TaxID=2895559 RepID=UPI001E2EE29D|nr:sigma-70 family RNA polymerase sigma factor [Subtercola endophyticus]UFS58758.1 sigma-70 family RNA polymerase sigma factor [Subtercola endophyticus]
MGSFSSPMQGGVVSELASNARAFPVLSRSEVAELATAIDVGLLARERLETSIELDDRDRSDLATLVSLGHTAFIRLMHCNLRLVVSIAAPFARLGVPLGDLVQGGNIGLLNAVWRFDHSKGFAFSTYATWWVRKAISDEISAARIIRLPHNAQVRLAQLTRTEEYLESELGRAPRDIEVADDLGMDLVRLKDFRSAVREPNSLNTLIEGTDIEVGQILVDRNSPSPEGLAETQEMTDVIRSAVKTLARDESAVLEMLYGLDGSDPLSYLTTADVLGVAPRDVRRLESISLAKLAHPSRRAVYKDLV